jgi:hypothetical protein
MEFGIRYSTMIRVRYFIELPIRIDHSNVATLCPIVIRPFCLYCFNGHVCATGITGGVFPIPGTTTLVCLAFIWAFNLNIGATQLANLLCTPLELVLVIPFVRMGEVVFGVNPPIDAAALLDGLKSNFFDTLGVFAGSILRAIVAWALFTAVVAPILYVMLRALLRTVLPQARGRLPRRWGDDA